jgi:maltooligosyltrehalose trehalohydrolase
LQTHDQVGNRANGDRISALVPPGHLAAGAALLLLGPFVPMLFMGEEWAAGTPWLFFTSYPDRDLGDAVTQGRRSEFALHGWPAESVPDPQDPTTLERSRLDWSEPGTPSHASMLEWYRTLIALRHEHPGLRDPDLTATSIRVDGGLAVLGRPGFTIVAWIGEQPRDLEVDGMSDVLAAYADGDVRPELIGQVPTRLLLPAGSVAVLR